jgi:hypothetical protein
MWRQTSCAPYSKARSSNDDIAVRSRKSTTRSGFCYELRFRANTPRNAHAFALRGCEGRAVPEKILDEFSQCLWPFGGVGQCTPHARWQRATSAHTGIHFSKSRGFFSENRPNLRAVARVRVLFIAERQSTIDERAPTRDASEHESVLFVRALTILFLAILRKYATIRGLPRSRIDSTYDNLAKARGVAFAWQGEHGHVWYLQAL